ncbi:hypothetical protein TTHERM_000522919 (macronuclear) [Tetrahymena thermophila SB210]|uniref:Transmembrane protein n=1 Tax=Tetrahymena thermophila (strain SB210) TaxID=312017 RepID=W7XDH1_TETTS|nr:hypothetical protein TTHERM_000522919 [Tetrahymena thermophila SB210]EWS74693.1 hypothetical protein TTHERM_000522919 [Tetrahymena thermophila SB210]|eukprot:XP_012652783.1 hypothetical protein TTHERM_000522919 [Tetrahymena thermophila SB210]
MQFWTFIIYFLAFLLCAQNGRQFMLQKISGFQLASLVEEYFAFSQELYYQMIAHKKLHLFYHQLLELFQLLLDQLMKYQHAQQRIKITVELLQHKMQLKEQKKKNRNIYKIMYEYLRKQSIIHITKIQECIQEKKNFDISLLTIKPIYRQIYRLFLKQLQIVFFVLIIKTKSIYNISLFINDKFLHITNYSFSYQINQVNSKINCKQQPIFYKHQKQLFYFLFFMIDLQIKLNFHFLQQMQNQIQISYLNIKCNIL